MGLGRFRLAAALVLASGARLAGHDLEAAVSLRAPVVLVKAAYGGTEPVAYAKVQIFAPSNASQEHQTGVTDRRGYFSFVPDSAGAWRVIVDDEEGHRREVAVTVPEQFEGAVAGPAAGSSRMERAITGLALIAGATGFLYGFKARRNSKPS